MARRSPRPLLFALAVTALLGSAVLLALREEDRPHPALPGRVAPPASISEHYAHPAARGPGRREGPGGEDLAPGNDPLPQLRAGRRAVAAAARSFLAAFLRYEVGEAGSAVRRALRAAATEEFTTMLLATPPRAGAAGLPARARLASLEVSLSAGAAPRAVASGRLRRGAGTEGFAFFFERRATGWLAAGVAE